MSAPHRHRHPIRRLLRRTLPLIALLALTATLAAALQVREVRVVGAHRFPARDVELVLRSALGVPTVATRAGALRARVLTVPWVADAAVRVSLDGVVTCVLSERAPVAVAIDGSAARLVDREGRLLAPVESIPQLVRLEGFALFPEETSAFLSARPKIERAWGAGIERVVRLGPHDVALQFAGTPLPVLADPGRPGELTATRRVLAAWTAKRPTPMRLDVRIAGRIAILPAPADPEGES